MFLTFLTRERFYILKHLDYVYWQEEEERRGMDSVDLIRASLDRKSAMG